MLTEVTMRVNCKSKEYQSPSCQRRETHQNAQAPHLLDAPYFSYDFGFSDLRKQSRFETPASVIVWQDEAQNLEALGPHRSLPHEDKKLTAVYPSSRSMVFGPISPSSGGHATW
jgi:hypothetical protein